MPVQELGSFFERLVMPVLLGSFLVGDPFNSINNQSDERAYAYGQYALIRRTAYEAIGGHTSVRNQILDDIALARVVAENTVFASTPLTASTYTQYACIPI